jgi:GT2 family glycosyltransferase
VLDSPVVGSANDKAASLPGLVAVVIVGFNEKQVLSECLGSWAQVPYHPLTLIYVDNASTDGTLEYVRRVFPNVVALSSGGNVGYCGGNNVGMRLAIESGAEYVLILNPDTVVYDPQFVTTLVNYLRTHPCVGKVGPRVFLRQPGQIQNTVLAWPRLGASFAAKFASRPPQTNTSARLVEPTQVEVLNGCCVLVRAAAIRDVGLYDEEYWCYVDEAEWDWRAEQAGWERHFVPIDSIVHHQKLAGYDFASRSHFLMRRNTALWFLNAGKTPALIGWMAVTMAMALGRVVTAPCRGHSVRKYLEFAGKLARAYAGIFVRLVTGQRTTPATL